MSLRKAQVRSHSERLGRAPADSTALPASAPSMLRMKLVGANPNSQMQPQEKLPGTVNYLLGDDPNQWRQNIPTFAKIQSTQVYPGIDLVYHGTAGLLEFDFVVAPGADFRRIQLAFEGAEKLELDAHGDLVFRMPGGELRQHKPVIYQQDGDTRRVIPGGFVLKDNMLVTFDVGRYDKSKPLTIDPTLWYSTYLGGGTDTGAFPTTGAFDEATGIAVTTNGSTYVVGTTDGSCFSFFVSGGSGIGFTACRIPATPAALDAFVAKYTATTDASQTPTLQNITFLGGSDDDRGEAIALDALGDVYVTGTTRSTNFPVRNAFQRTLAGGLGGGPGEDAFVVKLLGIPDNSIIFSPVLTTNRIVYSTYLGGRGSDCGFGIAVDSNRNAYVTGRTSATNFPTFRPFQRSCFGCAFGIPDAFVTKIGAAGSNLAYSTYLGGNQPDEGLAIAVSPGGLAHVTGGTASTNFPLRNPFQNRLRGTNDAFITKFGPTGTNLQFSTYFGGTRDEQGRGIAVRTPNAAYVHVVGVTTSTNFPTLISPDYRNAQTRNAGGMDAFVSEFFPTGTSLEYSLYHGGAGDDQANGISLRFGTAFVTGSTTSSNFPAFSGPQKTSGGAEDAFVSQYSFDGLLVGSTYFGGNGDDVGQGIAVDAGGQFYIAGSTTSTNFPVTNAVQSTFGGGSSDAFVAKIDLRTSQTGTFDLTPGNAAVVAVRGRLNYAFTWTVPAPLNWHDLQFLQLRIRDDNGIILSLLFDEASNTFVLLNRTTGQPERGSLPGRPNLLETPEATLHLAETSVVGSGPTGPSVTLNLSLSFKPSAAGRTFVVEVAASDDLGNHDDFAQAGTLTVTPVK